MSVVSCRAFRPGSRRLASVAVVLLGLVVGAACSGGDGMSDPERTEDPTSDVSTSPSTAAVATVDDAGSEALMRAAQTGEADAVRAMLAAGADPADPAVDTFPVLAAARNGHLDVVDELLEAETSPDPGGDGGPLGGAAVAGHVEIVRRLVDAGAEVDVVDSAGWSPLLWAAYGGHADAVRLLLDAGADPTVRATAGDFAGANALDVAAALGHDDVAGLLGDT